MNGTKMSIEKAIRLARKWSQNFVCTVREGEAQEYHKLCLEALQRMDEQRLLSPCDVCRYAPPSSGDGKPCLICPAVGKDIE